MPLAKAAGSHLLAVSACRATAWGARGRTAPIVVSRESDGPPSLCVSPYPPFFLTLNPVFSHPPGTYASYVLDADGQPLLRLRSTAVHTANLAATPRCSLFVQPADTPARLLARATLVGSVAPVDAAVADEAAARHAALHGAGVGGVDAPAHDDTYLRLSIDSCFFVAGLGPHVGAAAVIGGDEYRAATPDELRRAAPGLVAEFNADRGDEVARLAAAAAGVSADAVTIAELLWVDATGAYARVAALGEAEPRTVRVRFARAAADERDARSHLTMLCQLAWEAERRYVPPLPAAFGGGEAAGVGAA